MIKQFENLFVLETAASSYVFRVLESGHLEHLYYGKRLTIENAEDAELLCPTRAFPPGNSAAYSAEYPALSLEKLCQEVSSLGKGDYSMPFVDVIHGDGSRTSDFLFADASIGTGSPCEGDGLPHSWAGPGGETPDCLTVTLVDEAQQMRLEIIWFVYAECDVITRTAKLFNDSADAVRLETLASCQLDFPVRGTADRGMIFTTFTGGWGREMQRNDQSIISGRYVSESLFGASSSRANPFCMLRAADSSEDHGRVYGFNLIYSGNHRETVEFAGERIRFMTGIHPQGFEWLLQPGDAFSAPEAVLSFSDQGMNGLSQNMHDFVREHIVRGPWQHKARPVLLNSWEACYMDISERKILKLARAAKEAGIELMVMDDGWFGERNDDTKSLGDWTPDKNKLPGGVGGLCKKVNALGLDFGIWVEPEMVNVDSDLYRAHPDWTLEIPGHAHSEGRTQRFLDLSRDEVVDYLIGAMSELFASADIKYVKWDMNRNFTDVYSSLLPAEQQGEVAHRYMLGLYRLMRTLTEAFPQILFEGCASGGNRTDLGILCYFQQIWGSDNTDALCRAEIQTGYSYGYPLSVIGAHVSIVPNHQTGRVCPMNTRGVVAMAGTFGYELDLAKISAEEKEEIRDQVKSYKKYAKLIKNGDYYRLTNPFTDETASWAFVAEDKSEALVSSVQLEMHGNMTPLYVPISGLESGRTYRDEATGKLYPSDALEEMGLPITENMLHFKAYQWHLVRV